MNEDKISELLRSAGEDNNLELKAAIQIAKIVSSAPEERLPMILDIFSQAGIEIAGMDAIEALKEAARKYNQIDDLEGFLRDVTTQAEGVANEFRIPVDVFDARCVERGLKCRMVRRLLAEMGVIRINTVGRNGKQEFSVAVYSPFSKSIARCICIKANWKEILGVRG